MIVGHSVYSAGFGDQVFNIDCSNDNAYDLANFLFLDFPGATNAVSTHQYAIFLSGPEPVLSLFYNDKRLYRGTSIYQLSYILMNDVIHHCISNNTTQHAIHAGAVYRNDRCIVLPGLSGNGKSSLTSWLVLHGFQYMSDELIFLDGKARVFPLTRPISLKVGANHDSWPLGYTDVHESVITSENGTMIPHRLLNSDYASPQLKVTDIIFPNFSVHAQPGLQEISPARGCLLLLRSHVNARNFYGHGVHEIASIARCCRSFTLTYGNFDDLEKIRNRILKDFS